MKLVTAVASNVPRTGTHKYWHYLLVASALTIAVSVLALLNAYLDFNNVSSYIGISSSLLVAGYAGMFLTIFASPIPDYILVPVYGYLSSIGVFNPLLTFLVCIVASILPIPFVAGRLAGRPLLLKGLSYFHITEKDIELADDWLVEHGRFSIFTSTFIPFFYTIASLAAGTLKMNAASFMILSVAGFGIRFAFLEYMGYSSVDIFTSSFDYSQRGLFFLVLILSSVYVVAYLGVVTRSNHE
jgi:membrane protein DedA with SNARE-associated domain